MNTIEIKELKQNIITEIIVINLVLLVSFTMSLFLFMSLS